MIKKIRLSLAQKNANNKKWYEEKIDELDSYNSTNSLYSQYFNRRNMQINYDLFNGKLDMKYFEDLCKPFGKDFKLSTKIENRDIVSSKIKKILGMELKRPFSWKAVAVNPEATTRREEEQYKRIKEYVINSIMEPIKQSIMEEHQQELQGQELTDEQKQQIQQQIQQEIEERTPTRVKKFMMREYQDPSEILAQQLIEYYSRLLNLKEKFNKMFKHGMLSSIECMYVGNLNKKPVVWNVNSKNICFDITADDEFIENKSWVTCKYFMTPSEILKYFGDELTPKDIDLIYENYNNVSGNTDDPEDLFVFSELSDEDELQKGIEILHGVWEAPRRIGFLTYINEDGEEQKTIVDENYEMRKEFGDIELTWEWLPERYEAWKIKTSKPIYVNKRPIPGQFKDINNLYVSKGPYYGVVYDSMNSSPTSLMDRVKDYQYYYNIINYRIMYLMSSDKGKKLLMNIGAVPSDEGIDMKTWQYFFENTPFAWFNNKEEGTEYQDANNIGKVIDMSLVSDIKKYMELAEYIRQQAGRSIGMPEQMEGQMSEREAVRNVNQALSQSSDILELYLELHNQAKRNIIQGLLENIKVCHYNHEKQNNLSYVLDDMSIEIIKMDNMGLLDDSTIGIFLEDNISVYELIETIKQLSHAAMQNQAIDLSDIISIFKHKSVPEMEETLKAAEESKQKQILSQQQQQQEHEMEIEAKRQEAQEKLFEQQKELIIIKEEERRKTEIAKNSIIGASFNPDADRDKDGVNDFIEMAENYLEKKEKHEKDFELKLRAQEHKETIDNKKAEQQDKKIANEKEKIKLMKQQSKNKDNK